MHYVAQRIGLRIPPGLVVAFAIIAGVIGAAFWIGPFRPLPPEVQLLAAGERGFAEQVSLANAGTDAAPRFGLVLALRNTGRRAAHPTRLHVSVPGTFRLRSARYELPREVLPGNPLVRYTLPVEVASLEPDGAPLLLAALDTVWIEPQLDDYYCATMSDSIPEFAPAPRIDPARLGDLRAFYSVGDARFDSRATGVLRVRLDPAALARPALPRPPAFPTEIREPMVPAPALAALRSAGSRTALCGDPQQPLELFTTAWETPTGGRMLVVYLNGAPRKQLYDLDRDSIIELELWDTDADGRFEARRAARYPIPGFLLPERLPEVAVAIDSLADDPAWQLRFHDVEAGPFRFLPDSVRPPRLSLRPPVDSLAPPVAPPTGAPAPAPGGAAVPDTAWLRRFHDTAAGPYRFAPDPPPRLAPPPAPPARPRRQEPLGTPVPYPGANDER